MDLHDSRCIHLAIAETGTEVSGYVDQSCLDQMGTAMDSLPEG